jgi:hypothetical protein
MPSLLSTALINVPPSAHSLAEAMVPRPEDAGTIERYQQVVCIPNLGEGLTHIRQRPEVPKKVRLTHAFSIYKAILHTPNLFQGGICPSVWIMAPPRGVLLKEIPQESFC